MSLVRQWVSAEHRSEEKIISGKGKRKRTKEEAMGKADIKTKT